jgi:two-component system CheB/CheR fusion protein
MVRFFRRSNLEPRRLKLPRLPSSPAANGLLQQESASKTRESPETLYQQAILARHSPPYVVVGREREIVYSSGRISRFLELAPGTPRLDIVNLAKPALERPLKRLLMMEPSAAEPVCHAAVEGEIDGRKQPLLLSMERLKNGQRLIVFQDRLDPLRREDGSMPGGLSPAIDETYVRTLEDELEAATQTIRTTVEELETSNEELKSSNEEMMSMNEELQSANEELSTVNEELQNNVAEQNLLNTDLTNLIESTEIATIFLEENLTVRSYTPAALRFFRLVEHDRGRPLVDIASDIDTDRLIAATARMLRSEEVQEDEQQTRDGGEALLIRILPYRTGEGTARGAVLTFTPVTELRRYARELEWAEGLARQQLNEIEEFYRMSPQAMALVDRDLRYIRVNQRMAELGDLSVDNFLGRRVGEIEPALVPQVADPIRQVFETGQPILGDELTGALSADPEMRRTWEIDRYPIYSDGAISAVGMVVRDVSKHKQMEAELRRVMRELQHRVKNMLANVTALINRARRESGDPAVALERLVERVRALANTHNLLTAHNWSTARFIDILGPELVEVYGATRVSLKGPEILLNARAAVALSMAIHELATNAAKYGALSDPQGRLDLTWARTDEGDGEQLVIRWQEHGGPETRPPEAEGFGSQLIASTISGSLGGRIEKSFDPSGFRCVIEIPTARVIGDDDDDPSGPLET